MAIYRLEAKIISRGKGQSVVAAAAYRANEPLYSERDRETKFPKTTSQVLMTEIIAPEGAPQEIVGSRADLWNAVSLHEKRSDSMLARELLLSLPRELNFAEQVALVCGFVKELTDLGMVADIAFHTGTARDGMENDHAHVLTTIRGLSAEGWDHYKSGGKDQPWEKKAMLRQWRESWERHVNDALEKAGSDERVDHRSLKDRGIDRSPEPKLGPKVVQLEKQGYETGAGNSWRQVLHEREIFELRQASQELAAGMAPGEMEQLERVNRALENARLEELEHDPSLDMGRGYG